MRKRTIVVGLCVLAAFICYIDRVNISVAIIPMQEAFGWSDTTKGFVLSSFFIGYVLFQIPSGWLTNRFGGRILLGCAIVVWSLMTLLTPPAAAYSFTALIAVRILMGVGEAGAFPGAYGLFGQWVPPKERSRAIAALLSGLPLGTLFALAATGPIVTAFGWPSVFYIFGASGFVFAIAWFALVSETPDTHPTIKQREREEIGPITRSEQAPEIPWRQIFSNSAVWALIVNHFCSNWTFYVLLAWLPSYFSDALNVNLTAAGLLSVAPWVTMFLMTNIAARIADGMISRGVSVTLVRKRMQLTGLLGAAMFLLAAPTVTSAPAAVAIICGALGMLAFTWSGFAPNHLDIAPRYAGFLLGVTNTAGSVPGVIGITVTGFLLETTGSYTGTFVLAAAICSIGAVVWLLFGSAEEQAFAKSEQRPRTDPLGPERASHG
ncbi:MAG: ACS family MFS transporter [Pseudomonadota bacterium]